MRASSASGQASSALNCRLLLNPILGFSQSSQNTFSNISEEVIVTARKREEGSQSVPISISAFSGETLEEVGIFTYEDLDRVSPNLQVVKNGTKAFLSSICYYRGLFETKHFRSTKYGDLDITVLNTRNPERNRFSKLSMASATEIVDPPSKFLQWIEKGLYDMIV